MAEYFRGFFRVPKLTFARMSIALAVAVMVDGVQFLSGAFGWVGFDQALDVIAMIVITRLIGFHILLLPTFAINLVPVLEEFPTWIACVIAVGLIRRREQRMQKQAEVVDEPAALTSPANEQPMKQLEEKPGDERSHNG